MAVAAAVYLAWLGPDGLVEARAPMPVEGCLRGRGADRLSGVTRGFPGGDVQGVRAAAAPPGPVVIDAMVERGFLAGVPAPQAGDDVLVVAVTERRSVRRSTGSWPRWKVLAS